MKYRFILILLLSAIGFANALTDADFKVPTSANEIKVATYNVENLFDALHDEGKNDHTFLPLSFPGKTEACLQIFEAHYKKQCLETDWSDEKFQLKLGQIRKVIAAQGDLPDLLALEEMENEHVIRGLADALGYQSHLITDSPDKRGIDVGLLYLNTKLRYLNHEEIVLGAPLFDRGPTRNILRVHFSFVNGNGKDVLGVYVNHWPSQASTSEKRVAAAKRLQGTVEQQSRSIGKEHYYVVALGDFNTLVNEWPNAFRNVLSDPSWPLALQDVQELSEAAPNPMTPRMPPTTYWYEKDKTWSKLDRMVISKNLADGKEVELLPKSFRIVAPGFMTKPAHGAATLNVQTFTRVPLRYNFNTTKESQLGFSDHFPLVVKIKLWRYYTAAHN